jgi:hypothetical protein
LLIPHLCETITAIYGSSLGWTKWHGRFDLALRTLDDDFDVRALRTTVLRAHNRADSFVFSMLAWFTALWFVAQTFVSEKELFTCGKYELLTTFYARESFIDVFNHGRSPMISGKISGKSQRKLLVQICIVAIARLSFASSTVQRANL